MKRVKLFFQTRAENWAFQAKAVSTSDPTMVEGLRAFAHEQAVQFRTMRSHCEHIWRYVAEYVALGNGEVVPTELTTVDDDVEVVVAAE
jgi:hypothetical protein